MPQLLDLKFCIFLLQLCWYFFVVIVIFKMYINRYWAMPAFWLKRQLMLNLPTDNLEPGVAKSIDFMVDKVCNVQCYTNCIFDSHAMLYTL